MHPIPTLLITGFLGAGKTTLLRELLPMLECAGVSPFVILNDYRNARVDAATLAGDGREIAPISGNCVCCDSMAELDSTMMNLSGRPDRILLIEANGTSDPASLIEHILLNQNLRDRFHPVLQVAMVNAARWQKRLWNNEVERIQIESASHLIITHTAGVTSERLKKVEDSLVQTNRRAARTTPSDLGRELAGLTLTGGSVALPATRGRDAGHGHAKDHRHDHHALSHDFVATQLDLPPAVDREVFRNWLHHLPPGILRVKGIVRLTDSPDRDHYFERADDHKWGVTIFELKEPAPVPPCVILIGVKLDRAALDASLRQCG